MVKLGKGQREKKDRKQPHIALFISALRKGGSERVLVNLAEYLKDNGVEVTVVTQYEGRGILSVARYPACIQRDYGGEEEQEPGGELFPAVFQAAGYLESGAAGCNFVLYWEK